MPSYIIKPKPDEDFYVRYSTVVDSPSGTFGTREEMLAADVPMDRLQRADQAGTSAFAGWPFGWNETTIPVREGFDPDEIPDEAFMGEIARADLRALCETLGEDGLFHPPARMVTWGSPEEG